MKKSNRFQKLRLTTTTVRLLVEKELHLAQGGLPPVGESGGRTCSCNTGCGSSGPD